MNRHIYVNCQAVAEGTQPVKFQAVRTQPIIQDRPSLWKMAITRASLDCVDAPCFVPKMDYDNVNGNNTAYQITVKFSKNGDDYYETATLMFANNRGLAVPSVVPSSQNLVLMNPYYYMYDLNEFVRMFNNALAFIWGEFNDIDTKCPILQISGDKFNLLLDASGFANSGAGSNGETFVISFNDDLKNLLRTFDLIYDDSDQDLFYNVLSLAQCCSETTYDGTTYMVLAQSYPSMSGWSPIENFVFMSGTGDYREEINTDINVLGNNSILQQSNSIESQITDIDLDITNCMDTTNMVLYQPSILREIDISNDINIRVIVISVYWRDRYNQIHQLYFRDGGSFNCKIKFERQI